MTRHTLCRLVLVALLGVLVGSCGLPDEPVQPREVASGELLVATSLGQTIEAPEATGSSTAVLALTGASPNRLYVRDGAVYAVNSLSNDIRVYDAATWEEIQRLDCGPGCNPMQAAWDEQGGIWVSCWLADSVLRFPPGAAVPTLSIDLSDQATATAAARPEAIIVRDSRVFVGLSMLRYDDFTPEGPSRLAILGSSSGERVTVRTLQGRNLATLLPDPTDASRTLALHRGDFSTGEGYLGNGGVEVLSGREASSIAWYQAPEGAPGYGSASPAGVLWLSNANEARMLRFDLLTSRYLPTLPIAPAEATRFTLAADVLALDDETAWVASFNDDQLVRIDSEGNELERLDTGDGPIALTRAE